MVLVQISDGFQSGVAAAPINYTSWVWQSIRYAHRRCSQFCFIELIILPERAKSYFFSYHVHSDHDRRGYRYQEVSDIGHSILQSGQIPIRKFIRKLSGSMFCSASESSDHLTNISFPSKAQDLFFENVGCMTVRGEVVRETWPMLQVSFASEYFYIYSV